MGVGHPSSLQTMCRLSTVVHAFFCVPVSALHRSALFLSYVVPTSVLSSG